MQDKLKQRWSPEQIARRSAGEFPDQPQLHVVHETIYQALYLPRPGRAAPGTAQLAAHRPARRRRTAEPTSAAATAQHDDDLRTPAEASDRAVPGHWEGDLIIGKNNRSAIGTLVERSTRYVLLAPARPAHRRAVRDAVIAAMRTLPAHLRRSLTWDQGSEMALHPEFTIAAGMPVYFCDPASPWQRGPQREHQRPAAPVLPQRHRPVRPHRRTPRRVAAELNGRPRKTLDWKTPAERLATLLN